MRCDRCYKVFSLTYGIESKAFCSDCRLEHTAELIREHCREFWKETFGEPFNTATLLTLEKRVREFLNFMIDSGYITKGRVFCDSANNLNPYHGFVRPEYPINLEVVWQPVKYAEMYCNRWGREDFVFGLLGGKCKEKEMSKVIWEGHLEPALHDSPYRVVESLSYARESTHLLTQFVIEKQDGTDAMGVTRWRPVDSKSDAANECLRKTIKSLMDKNTALQNRLKTLECDASI